MRRQTEKRIAIVVALGLAIAFMAIAAHAAVRNLTITLVPPTTYTDDSPIAAGDITHYGIVCNYTPTGGTASACQLAEGAIGGTRTTVGNSITYSDNGGRMCMALVTVTALHGSSTPGQEVCRDLPAWVNPVPAKRPRPVQGLTIVVGPQQP